MRGFVAANYSTESLVWALSNQQGNEWRHGLAPIEPRGQYQMIVEGVSGKSFEGDIALDDIGVLPIEGCTLTPVDADPIQASQQAISCGFERDFCQWQFDLTGKFNWTRHTDATPSSATGPSSGADNTPYYIYIEASDPQEEGDRAGLISPFIARPKRGMCFQFYYHM